MKYRILAVIVIFVMLLSITVKADSYEFSISSGNNFTSAQYGDDLSEISKKLNMSTDELNAYFNQNGLIYLAVSNDNKTQIKLSAFTDNFSSAAGDISNLNDQTLSEFASAVGEDSQKNAHVVLNNGRQFVCVKNIRKDSGGVYTVTQYITICDNKTFYFAGYNEGDDTSTEIANAFQSFHLQQKPIDTPDYTVPTVFVIVGIVMFSLVAVVMIVSIIKSYFKDKSTNVLEVSQNED